MALFKVNRYQQVKLWMAQDIYFEAKNINEAKKLAKAAQKKEVDIGVEILDWGSYKYSFETEEATGHYDCDDRDIDDIEMVKS